MKQKFIEIKRSKYGDWFGLVNGKFKYQDPNAINLKAIKGHVHINVDSWFGTAIVKLPEGDFASTLSGEFDFGARYYPYLPNLTKHLSLITLFTKNHWKEIVHITGSLGGILSALKTFGILAIPQSSFKN